MDAGWIEALTELWRGDSPIDFAALEKEWQLQPLETSGTPAPTPDNPEPARGRLLVCLTGYPDRELCTPPAPPPTYGSALLTKSSQSRSARSCRSE